jgi:subtilisin family serine protease
MNALELVQLPALMDRTSGRSDVAVGLIDGPVARNHPDLASDSIHALPGTNGVCAAATTACVHGTAVAGILSAKRGSAAPAICPRCTLLVRPIFVEAAALDDEMPSTSPEQLAHAILDCLDARARVVNISAALARPCVRSDPALTDALDRAASAGVIVVAAAGNQGTLGSTVLTRHPWVLSVIAYNLRGRPTGYSNLGRSIGRGGIGAPGENITSLGVNGQTVNVGGTSAAAAFVTGTIALLLSEYPSARPSDVRLAIRRHLRRATVVPPLLNAAAAYYSMAHAPSKA